MGLDTYSFNKIVFYGRYVEKKEYLTPFKVGKREKHKKKYVAPDFKIIDSIDEIPKYVKFENSLSRTRKSIYDLISCNVAFYPKFLTLTCKESILDYDKFLYEMKLFFKRMKRKGFDLKYIWVAEHQAKRGLKEGNEGSYHAHIIIFNDEYIPFEVINSCWNGNTDIHIFESCRYKDNIKTDEKIKNVSAYVTKYITKENLAEFGKNLYHCSRGLNRPIEIREIAHQYYDKDGNKKYIRNDNLSQNLTYDWFEKNMKAYNSFPYMNETYSNEKKYICCTVTQGTIPNMYEKGVLIDD